MDKIKEFELERKERIRTYKDQEEFIKIGLTFMEKSFPLKYSYNFSWLGRPIIQYPQDIIAMQEIIWNVKPDLIIETGIAHGGSLVFYASILELIGGDGKVLGIDIDIRPHNRKAMTEHPMYKRITLLEGSSISEQIIKEVENICKNKKCILVCLDSHHTYDHVMNELELYSHFVSLNSYLIVFDTIIEDLPNKLFKDRPWGKGNNPKTAVEQFLKKRNDFVIDESISNKLIISVSPNGFLKRIL